MDTVTVAWHRGWLARLSGRNPLVRSCDRVEAVCLALTATALVMAMSAGVAPRRRLENTRYGEWDRELAELVDDRGGRRTREPRLPDDGEM